MISSKMDRQGARTPADLEQKYKFGQKFSEVYGLAEEAKSSAEDAMNAVGNLDTALTPEEIFNRLTANGTVQGMFRGDDGQIYINANYIVALEELFAKDITMTGSFIGDGHAYLPPSWSDLEMLKNTYYHPNQYVIPRGKEWLYDLNGDGVFDQADLAIAEELYYGRRDPADWAGVRNMPNETKMPIKIYILPSDPERVIFIQGITVWGTAVELSIGVNLNFCSFVAKEHMNRMFNLDTDGSIYRMVDGEKEWLNPPMLDEEYRTYERYSGFPVYTTKVGTDYVDSFNPYEFFDKSTTGEFAIIRKGESVDMSAMGGIAMTQVWYIYL